MSRFKSICICGSMSVREKMLEIQQALEAKGIEVSMPSMEETNDYSVLSETETAAFKNEMMVRHLARIQDSDAILVVNETLKGIESYIGANSFLEMGFAFALKKPILLLNAIPNQPNKDELLGLHPEELRGDLGLI